MVTQSSEAERSQYSVLTLLRKNRKIQGVPSGLRPRFCCLWLLDWNLAELIGHLGNRVEHPNQSQPRCQSRWGTLYAKEDALNCHKHSHHAFPVFCTFIPHSRVYMHEATHACTAMLCKSSHFSFRRTTDYSPWNYHFAGCLYMMFPVHLFMLREV